VVQISITGVATGATVTSKTTGPGYYLIYTWPTLTDGSGNWSTTATEASGDVGTWTEYWYINDTSASGTPITPNNPSQRYLKF
jgi:hypothetical protein